MSKIRSIVAAQSSVGEPEHRGDERSEAARSGGSPTFEPDVVPVVPDSEVPARHARRRFTTAYKLDILRRADACGGHGELGQLLRAEGLYSSHLGTWRQQREAGLMPKTRGWKPTAVDPQLKKLEQENRRLTSRPRPAPPRALDPVERQSVVDLLHTRFIDQAPAQVHATLLDEGTYLCSPRTMYRVLDAAHEIKERRNQVRRPHYAAPELLATRPNAVWSWDITKLRGPATWTYFYLYVILDIFSRYVVGWMIAPRESAVLAERLIADTCAKHGIHPGQLTLHADRGTSMKSKPVALLLADLGVTKTHSRPHVSNDNPFSEAQFKTLKYGPLFPERFGSIADGRAFGQSFFPGYNHEHRHSGLGFLTPAVVHFGQAAPVRAHRQQVLAAAYTAHPERFVNGPPRPADLPTAVWINPPVKKSARQDAPGTTIVHTDYQRVARIQDQDEDAGLEMIDRNATLIKRWTPSFGQVFVTAKVESGVMIQATLG